jgi:hypothetical protein
MKRVWTAIFCVGILWGARAWATDGVVMTRKCVRDRNPLIMEEVFSREGDVIARFWWKEDVLSRLKLQAPRVCLKRHGRVPDGRVRVYSDSGHLKELRVYKNNRLHGDVYRYYAHQALKAREVWLEGRLQLKKVYAEDGTLVEEINYFQNRPKCYTRYDARGQVTEQGCY